jgi:hypothetical protein
MGAAGKEGRRQLPEHPAAKGVLAREPAKPGVEERRTQITVDAPAVARTRRHEKLRGMEAGEAIKANNRRKSSGRQVPF